MAQNDEIRYLTPQGSDQKKKKYCRFKKSSTLTTRILSS